MDSLLTHLGLARRAGKLAIGEVPVREALDARTAKAVFLAADAAEHTARKVTPRLGDVPLHTLPATKQALGQALGRASCAVCAVLDAGFAKALIRRLDPSQPGATTDGGVLI